MRRADTFQTMRTTITVPEISDRLGICEETVYDMLRDQAIPNIRYGRRFIVSRAAYERWEASIGESRPEFVPNAAKPLAPDSATSNKARPPRAA
jgi:excisionase family DNA binding protein